MRLIDLRHVGGPNIYASRPVSVARLELDELTGQETTGRPGFAERLAAALPGLAGHHCAAGEPGGFLTAMANGTYFGHVTEHVALELSTQAGREVHLGRTMWAGADGRYDVMMECPQDEPADSAVPTELLRAAIALVHDVLARRDPNPAADVAAVAALVETERLGVSTAAIASAARRRGIPVRRAGRRSLLRLGYGTHRRLVCAALTDHTSAVGVDIASDKVAAKDLLTAAGIPVPAGLVVASPAEAARALEELGAPVVVKPRSGNHGGGVTVRVTTPAQAAAAYAAAATTGREVIVETFVPGHDFRVLMVDGRMVAAAQLRPAAVTGDGTATIGELVAAANADPRRGAGHTRELTRITVDAAVRSHLAGQGYGPDTVPAAGELVTLRQNANLSTGGTSRDVTEQVHPDVAALCCRAAAVAGLDVCGLDLRLADIAAPLDPAASPAQAGAVIELNACPGLRMHVSPAEGQARDVAGAVVDRLYPPGAPSRVPVVAVTGTNGKTTTVRLIGHILQASGLRVGMASTDGVQIGGKLVVKTDASGPRSAALVLDDASVEAAVLETARGGIIRGGLGYDQADVAVITNISADHLGTDGVEDLDDLAHVKALVAERIRAGGSVVLNADDPVTAAIADRPAVRRRQPEIRYFSLDGASPVLRRHQRAGGVWYELAAGQLVERQGSRTRVVAGLAEVPGAFGGLAPYMVANALAAIAACRAAGISAKDIRDALASFRPDEANPGRASLYLAGGCPVIVDYGHNEAALAATGAMISNVWGGQPVAAVTLPGDRRDDLVTATAAAIAAWFPAVVVYEDRDKRGRRPGEMQELILSALRRARPGLRCATAGSPAEALRTAVGLATGQPVLFLHETFADAQAALDAAGAVPYPPRPDPEPGPARPAPWTRPRPQAVSAGMDPWTRTRPETAAAGPARLGAVRPGSGPAGSGPAGSGSLGAGPLEARLGEPVWGRPGWRE